PIPVTEVATLLAQLDCNGTGPVDRQTAVPGADGDRAAGGRPGAARPARASTSGANQHRTVFSRVHGPAAQRRLARAFPLGWHGRSGNRAVLVGQRRRRSTTVDY